MDVIKLILLCFNKIRNGWRVFIKSICLVGGICPQGTKLRKANFFNLKRGHCSNALQIQIGIDPLRGVEEEEGEEEGGGDGRLIKVKGGVCCIRSYLLLKRQIYVPYLTTLPGTREADRGTGCHEKHFSLLMLTNYSPSPRTIIT